MDINLLHETTLYTIDDKTTELYLQLGLMHGITSSLHVGGTYAMSLGVDLSGISELDLKLNYALFKHLHIMGGYRWLEYNYLIDEENSSIQVNFRGSFLGIYIPF